LCEARDGAEALTPAERAERVDLDLAVCAVWADEATDPLFDDEGGVGEIDEDEVSAILEINALSHAVGRDEDLDGLVCGERGELACAWREAGEQVFRRDGA
jgi:hypothetical protein